MAKRGRHKRGGRVTPKGTRPPGVRPKSAPPDDGLGAGYPGDDPWGGGRLESEAEPDLLGDIRAALAEDRPLGLLGLASSLLAVVDPRMRNPFQRQAAGSPAAPTRDDLVTSLMAADRPETSALLSVVGHLASDEVLQARIRREIARRGHPLPPWLSRLGDARVVTTVEMVHILGDGDDVMLDVQIPDGHELAVVIYIDHNLGTVVKDAFVVAEPLTQLIELMRANVDDPDTSWNDLRPADARARITDAVATGAMTIPPFETDTWPMCRPLVEWAVRLLPEGGTGYERPEWNDAELADLANQYFDSPFAGADDADQRSLLDSLLWFASAYGPGDPLRWSPVSVEILLEDWIPRKIVADAKYLAKAPDLLRAFIRFGHDELGIRSSLTDETLAAVDHHAAEYQRIIRSPRLQGPAAILAAMEEFQLGADPGTFGDLDDDGDDDLDDEWEDDFDDKWDLNEAALEWLARRVGGREAMQHLDAKPLPAEDFDWSELPADVHGLVAEVLDRCDRWCDEMLDAEYRTACRRFLARVAARAPETFRRASRSDTAAAAVCWTIGKANELFLPSGGGMRVKDLMDHFGIQGSISSRAATMLRASGFSTSSYDLTLDSPDYLVSSYRHRLINRRDRLLDDG